jgi:hypothetical protein
LITDKKNLRIYKCPSCINKGRKNKLYYKNKDLIYCKKCKTYFATYMGFPVLIVENEDLFHLRKALLKPKFRIFDYEN